MILRIKSYSIQHRCRIAYNNHSLYWYDKTGDEVWVVI